MASTRQHFVWGWGRLPRSSSDISRSTPPTLCPSPSHPSSRLTPLPRLLEALETSTSLRSISAASHHTLAVTNSGEAYTWGTCGPAVIDDDTSDPPYDSPSKGREVTSDGALRFRQVYGVDGVYQVAVLSDGMFAITATNDVFGWRWGADTDDSTDHSILPSRSLIPHPLPSLTAMSCTSIACGPNFALFLTSSGLLFTLGNPSHPSPTPSTSPPHPALVSLHPLLLTRISAGFAHAAAITHTGQLLTWGCSLHGRLGNGRLGGEDVTRPMPVGGGFDAAVVDVACGYGHTLALDVEGRVWSMGSNARGQCGWGEEEPGSATMTAMCAHPVLVEGLNEQVVAISAGAFHSAAITAVSELLVWGWNAFGQLGIGGDEESQAIPTPVAALSGMDVRLVSCGADYTVAVTDHFMSIDADYFASAMSHTTSDLHPSTSFTNGEKKEGEKEDEEQKVPSSNLNPSTITRSTSSSLSPSPDTPVPIVFDESETVPRDRSADGDVKLRSQSTPINRTRKSMEGGSSSQSVVKGEGEKSLLSLVKEALLITPLPDDLPDELDPSLSKAALPASPTTPLLNSSSMSSSSSALSSLSFSFRRRRSSVKKEKDRIGGDVSQSSSFNAMTSAYLSKLHRTAKEAEVSRIEEEKRLHKEERVRAEETRRNAKREKAMEEAATEWTKTILPRWSEPKIRARAREMVNRFGIPTKIRGQVWPVAIGNALMIHSDLYKILSERANRFKAKKRKRAQQLTTLSPATPPEADQHGGGDEGEPVNDSLLEDLKAFGKAETVSYIDTDLARTFPSLAFFQEECAMHEQLRSILYTFSFYRPDVGYVQGMSYCCAYLLLYMPPFKTFVSFCNLLNSPFFHCFLKMDSELTELRYKFFLDLLHEHSPALSFHLTAQGVTPDLYLLEWCMTLFCKRLKLDVVGRVWDLYIMEGEIAVYRVGVGLLMALNEGGRMLKEEMGEVLRRLSREGLDMEEERLMGEVHKVQVSEKMRQRLQSIINLHSQPEEVPL